MGRLTKIYWNNIYVTLSNFTPAQFYYVMLGVM